MNSAIDFSKLNTSLTTNRLLTKVQVMNLTGLSKSTIYLYIKQKTFPPAIRIGVRRVGWLESEVMEWINNKINNRNDKNN